MECHRARDSTHFKDGEPRDARCLIRGDRCGLHHAGVGALRVEIFPIAGHSGVCGHSEGLFWQALDEARRQVVISREWRATNGRFEHEKWPGLCDSEYPKATTNQWISLFQSSGYGSEG